MKISAWLSFYLSHPVDGSSSGLFLCIDVLLCDSLDPIFQGFHALISESLAFSDVLAEVVEEGVEHQLVWVGIGFPEFVVSVELVYNSAVRLVRSGLTIGHIGVR